MQGEVGPPPATYHNITLMETYKNELLKLGLNTNQALVYELLIKNGSMRASRLSGLVGKALSRPMVYALLDELLEAGLVEKEEIDGVTRFSPAHPSALQSFVERERATADAKSAVASLLIPKIVSDYNLTGAKPGVRFFEGDHGMRMVLEDSLTAKTEVYSYADLESIQKYIPDINTEYVNKRERLSIKKKGLVPDSPFNRKILMDYHKQVTDARLLCCKVEPFKTVMQIYDNKVSYLTLGTDQKIGVIIEDPHIYAMHKYLFEHLWEITPATPIPPPAVPES